MVGAAIGEMSAQKPRFLETWGLGATNEAIAEARAVRTQDVRAAAAVPRVYDANLMRAGPRAVCARPVNRNLDYWDLGRIRAARGGATWRARWQSCQRPNEPLAGRAGRRAGFWGTERQFGADGRLDRKRP